MEPRFEARKRTAIDGRVWWCVYDNKRHAWSTFVCHGKYKTKKACVQAIAFSQMEKVKADAKEFRARYTDGDLKRTFEDATDCSVYGDIIKCTVEAFSCWGMGADTSFFVSQVVESAIGFEKFSYYCDMNLNVSMDPLLLTHKTYWKR